MRPRARSDFRAYGFSAPVECAGYSMMAQAAFKPLKLWLLADSDCVLTSIRTGTDEHLRRPRPALIFAGKAAAPPGLPSGLFADWQCDRGWGYPLIDVPAVAVGTPIVFEWTGRMLSLAVGGEQMI